jgi:hypothetical protein
MIPCDRVFLIQKRAVRILCGLKWRDSCKPAFGSHQILTYYDAYILEVVCFVRQHWSEFSSSIVHEHCTRNLEYLLPPHHKTSNFQKNLVFMECKLYNKLNSEIRNIVNFKNFKRSVNYKNKNLIYY